MSIKSDYQEQTAALLAHHPAEKALSLAVGGDFENLGLLERELLIMCGLKPEHFLIDVGCGSGRLTQHLVGYLTRYLGTDLVPELLDQARRLGPGFQFEEVDGISIPAEDAEADFVCFFSVLTHLRHEESYNYLKEALRVIKPDGKILFSFLEFKMQRLWNDVFERMIVDTRQRGPLIQFMNLGDIEAWVDHLGCKLVNYFPGDPYYIPIPRPIVLESGERFEKLGTIGQSACLLVPG